MSIETTHGRFFVRFAPHPALDNSPRGTQTNPATSCKDIKDSGDSTGSALYWLRPANPYQAYCDMVGGPDSSPVSRGRPEAHSSVLP